MLHEVIMKFIKNDVNCIKRFTKIYLGEKCELLEI